MAGKVLDLDDKSFEATVGKGLVLVDFWAPWCSPCRAQGPIVEAVAAKAGGAAVVAKLNIDVAPATAAKHGIQSIPTLVVFRDGKEEKRLTGRQDEKTLLAALGVKA